MIFADKLVTLALLGLLSLPVPAMAGISAQDWGVTADDGRPAKLFTLTNANGMEARISSYGGVVVSLTAPDRTGKFADVVQGFDSLTDYTSADYLKSNGHYGAIVGRFANRIRGAKVTLDGKSYALDPDKDGNLDQGGTMAYFRQVFRATPERRARAEPGSEPHRSRRLHGLSGQGRGHHHLYPDPQQCAAGRHARHHRQEDGDQPDQPFLFQAVGCADGRWGNASDLRPSFHADRCRQHSHRRNPRRDGQRFRFHQRRRCWARGFPQPRSPPRRGWTTIS